MLVEKESYNIDDILSEVKKRREQESESLKIKDNVKEEEQESQQERDDLKEEIKSDSSEQIEEDETVVSTDNEEPDAKADEEEKASEETQPLDEDASEAISDDVSEGYVDILSFADDKNETVDEVLDKIEINTEPEKKKVPFFKTKQGKILKWIIVFLVIAILIVGVFAGLYVYKLVNNISNNDTQNRTQSTKTWEGMSGDIENFPEIIETDASQLSSLQDMIKTWYYNGAPASASNVFNVLLIGEDTRGDDILDDETRADSAIIVSVNIETEIITLTSVLRDTYAYWENEPGNPDTGEFGKINGAMISGIGTYINCVEKMYKVDIDNYAIVNFDSFKSIIDKLGGVEIEISSAEIREINNHPNRYGDVYIEKSFDGSSGKMLLSGEQALAYCRIRYLDSDAVRADRQKTCLFEVFNKTKDSSTATQLKVIDALMPYVKTGFGSGEVISIAKYAFSKGWLGYDIEMVTVPYTKKGGEFYGAWCWKTDFPQDAHYLQTMLYGKSSVILAQERIDYANCNLYGFYEDTLVPTYSTITNYNYKETTTYPSEDEEETTSQY